jgi:uncharacterized protein
MNTKNNLDINICTVSLHKPWWKEPYVWMVISGPLAAVVACVVTAFYVMQGPDAVLPEIAYPQGQAINSQVLKAQPAMQPAQISRNHSATGGKKNE